MNLDRALSILALVVTLAGGAGVVLVTQSRVDRAEQDIAEIKATKASTESVSNLEKQLSRIEGMLSALAAAPRGRP